MPSLASASEPPTTCPARRTPSRARRPWPRTSPCRPPRAPSRSPRCPVPNIAIPMLAVIGGAASPAGACSRIAVGDRLGDLLGLVERRSGGGRSRTRRRRAGRGRRSRACRALQHAGDLLDHPVADRVAERVVDLLEVVEVEHQHRAGRLLAAAAGELGAQVLLEAAPVLQPGQRVVAGLPLQLLHPLVAAPDQDQSAEQRRQGDAEDGDQRPAGRPRVGSGRGRPAARCGRRSERRGGRVVERQVRAQRSCGRPRPAARRRSSGRAEVAAAARSGTWKAPAAKPISAARRWATVAVGAPSR